MSYPIVFLRSNLFVGLMFRRYDAHADRYDGVRPASGSRVLFGNHRSRPHFLGGETHAELEADYPADNS